MLGSNLETLTLARFALRVNARFEFFGDSGPSLVRYGKFQAGGVRTFATFAKLSHSDFAKVGLFV